MLIQTVKQGEIHGRTWGNEWAADLESVMSKLFYVMTATMMMIVTHYN
jgi:hypothetical protein